MESPKNRRGIAWWALVLVMAMLILWPLVNLEAKMATDTGAFRRALDYPGLGTALLNTLVLAVGTVVIAVPSGTTLAWVTLRTPPRMRGVVAFLPMVPLMLPPVAKVAGWTYLLSPRTGVINQLLRETGLFSSDTGPIDIYTMAGMIAISGITLTSFVYLFVSASLRQRGVELELAASTFGANGWETFGRVTLPLLRPALTYSTGIVFLLALGQFTTPLLLGGPRNIEVISTVMYRVASAPPVDYAMGAVLAVPLLLLGVLVVVGQRWAIGDERRFVAMSGRGGQVGTRSSWWALIPVALYLGVAVVLPLAALIVVSLVPYWSGRIDVTSFTFANWDRALSNPATQEAISTTGWAVLFTVIIVVPLGYLCALALVGRSGASRLARRSVDMLSSVSLSMPAVLLGFAFLLTYTEPPFRLYGTTAMVVVAYVSLMVPHAIRPQLSAMMTVGPEYAEAARVGGAGPLATAWRVGMPLTRTGISVAASLVVIMVVHEFAVSLMVTSPGRRVMGALLYDATNFGTAPQIAVVALLMVVVSSIGIVAAVLIGGTKSLERT
nr:iron ABC transporter permease [Dactylosporangium thailandense]